MAGSVTQVHNKSGNIKTIVFSCVGHETGGAFPATAITDKIEGYLLAIETNPGATAPTDNWDLTIVDGHGVDVLQAVGANFHTTTSQKRAIVFSSTSLHPPVSLNDTLTLTPSGNSVNSAIIVITLYYSMIT